MGNATYVTGNTLINFCRCCICVKKTDKKTSLTGCEDSNFCELKKGTSGHFYTNGCFFCFFFFFDFVEFSEITQLLK